MWKKKKKKGLSDEEIRKAFERAMIKRATGNYSVPDDPDDDLDDDDLDDEFDDDFDDDELDGLEDTEKLNEGEHQFSPRFERKMKWVLFKADNKLEWETNIPFRQFITILAAMVIAASFIALTAFGVKGVLKGLFMNNFDTHTNVKMADSDSSPKVIEDIYSFDVPEGFELKFETDDVINNRNTYQCEYRNGEDKIYINQITKNSYNNNVNTEENAVECININGHEGYMIEMGESECNIVWDNGDYIIEVFTNTGKNIAIDVANSAKKAE